MDMAAYDQMLFVMFSLNFFRWGKRKGLVLIGLLCLRDACDEVAGVANQRRWI